MYLKEYGDAILEEDEDVEAHEQLDSADHTSDYVDNSRSAYRSAYYDIPQLADDVPQLADDGYEEVECS